MKTSSTCFLSNVKFRGQKNIKQKGNYWGHGMGQEETKGTIREDNEGESDQSMLYVCIENFIMKQIM